MVLALFNSVIGKVLIGIVAIVIAIAALQTMRVNSLKDKLNLEKAKVVELTQLLETERKYREEERDTERETTIRTVTFCRVERDRAIVAGRAIQGIIDGKDASGANRGDIVTADELRNVVSEETR